MADQRLWGVPAKYPAVALALAAILLVPGFVEGAPLVRVEGNGICPGAAEVARRLVVLLPDADPGVPSHVARIQAERNAVRVRLFDENGRRIAERTLGLAAGCDELAEAVAVVIASWEASFHPELIPAPGLSMDAPLSSQVVPPVPPQAAAPMRVVADGAPRGAAWAFELGMGPIFSASTEGGAPGALFLARASRPGRSLGLSLSANGTLTRNLSIGQNQASWRRWSVGLGPAYQEKMSNWRVMATAWLSAGWLTVEGSDFPIENRQGARFSLSAMAGVRLARRFKTVTPWAFAGAVMSLTVQELTVIGSTTTRQFRPWEGVFGLGVSFGAVD